MKNYPFIFSNEPPHRLRRHLCFWLLWWLSQGLLYSFAAGLLSAGYFRRLPVSMLESLLFLVPHTFLAYSLIYFVVPRLVLKARYTGAALAVSVLFVLTGGIASAISVYVVAPVRTLLLGRYYNAPLHLNEFHFFYGLLAGLRGAITVGGLAAAIKLMKYWYAKEQRNLQLQKENVASQLQLLKAQVHPHFLFNTLNNIYSSAQVSSPVAAGMLMSLSQLLRYMLYEGNQPLVPLDRELAVLRQYMLLEQSRYGDALDMNCTFPPDNTGLAIAPLLLLPFVENCFKHGTSQVLEQPWISLHVSVENDWLKMKLVNGKAEEASPVQSGIGLSNVQKRLALLYPGRHELAVTNEDHVFIVNLKLQLQKTVSRTIGREKEELCLSQ